MAKQRARVQEPGGTSLPVPDPKKLLKLYYAGLQLPSPQGGFLELLRVRSEEDKSATALFECNTSSLRYSLSIPAASRTERSTAIVTAPRRGAEKSPASTIGARSPAVVTMATVADPCETRTTVAIRNPNRMSGR